MWTCGQCGLKDVWLVNFFPLYVLSVLYLLSLYVLSLYAFCSTFCLFIPFIHLNTFCLLYPLLLYILSLYKFCVICFVSLYLLSLYVFLLPFVFLYVLLLSVLSLLYLLLLNVMSFRGFVSTCSVVISFIIEPVSSSLIVGCCLCSQRDNCSSKSDIGIAQRVKPSSLDIYTSSSGDASI
jgi:hypothetical protein